MTLKERETKGGRTTYEPLIARVSAVGNPQYGRNLAFTGIDGFWGLRDGEVMYGQGEIVKVLLATKPKINKPDQLYRDIDRIRVATETEKSGYVAPERSPQDATGSQYADESSRSASGPATAPLRDAGGQPTPAYWKEKDRQIKLGMAFNNLTHMVISMQRNEDTESWFQQNWNLWGDWFNEASRGLPLTPVNSSDPEGDSNVGDSEQDAAQQDEDFQQAIDRDDARDFTEADAKAEATEKEGTDEDARDLHW